MTLHAGQGLVDHVEFAGGKAAVPGAERGRHLGQRVVQLALRAQAGVELIEFGAGAQHFGLEPFDPLEPLRGDATGVGLRAERSNVSTLTR